MNAYVRQSYKDYLLEIKNSTTYAELYVDGKLIDSQKGLFSVELSGVLPTGEKIVAKLKWGVLVPKCSFYVNGTLLEE